MHSDKYDWTEKLRDSDRKDMLDVTEEDALAKLLSESDSKISSNAEFAAFIRAVVHCKAHGCLPLDDGTGAEALHLTPDEFAVVWPKLSGWYRHESGYRHRQIEAALKWHNRAVWERVYMMVMHAEEFEYEEEDE